MAEHLLGGAFPGIGFPDSGNLDTGLLDVWGCWTPALSPDRRTSYAAATTMTAA